MFKHLLNSYSGLDAVTGTTHDMCEDIVVVTGQKWRLWREPYLGQSGQAMSLQAV